MNNEGSASKAGPVGLRSWKVFGLSRSFKFFHIDLFKNIQKVVIFIRISIADARCSAHMLAEFSLQGQKLIVDPRLDKKVPVVELQGGRTL